MTITLGPVNTGTHLHGAIQVETAEHAFTTQQWHGVNGEYPLWGGWKGTDLSCWLLLYGFASHAAVQVAIEALDSLKGSNGNLTVTVNGVADNVKQNVTFLGFEPQDDAPWYDAAGVNGWQILGTMRFRWSK